ncbi:molecular chaperone DnaJ [Pseudonocardia eucalypti]|uniref:Chaperone protein DnaJ n=1 Tax=Pseudonocardia eucalypti TaxID=648755 RepID=A0ABP9QTC8_9PSEU
MARDYYGALGVSTDAGADEIKRAYRRLARELHPDVNPDPGARERFAEVKAAYEVLSDPEKRRLVDLGGDPLDNGGGRGGGGDPFAGFGGLGDIMDAFFGATTGGGAGRGPRNRVQPGADALIRMRLTLEECAAGLTRDLTVDTAVLCSECTGSGCAPGTSPTMCDICHGRGEVQSVQRSFLGQVVTSRPCPNCRGMGEVITDPCRQCGGDGRVRARRTVKVKMPAGVADGMRVRLAGQGEVGSGGGPAGDLYVEVDEEPHDVFTREGVDLHCVLPLPMTTAALGTTVRLPTLVEGEELELDIEPGTQTGTVRTMRGKGMPRLRSSGRVDGHGDLMVHIEVLTPTKLDTRQAELLRELAALRGDEQPDLTVGGRNGGGLFARLRGSRGGR